MTSFNDTDAPSSQRVAAALREARERLEAAERAVVEPIAIVGMGCRFPGGANDPAAYWERLVAGFDAVHPIPGARYDVDAYYQPTPATPGALYTRHAALLDHIDGFDPAFFGISPREAIHMDPQQRLLLEVAWEALEHAGQAPDRLRGSRTGVFVGLGRSDHAQRALNGAAASLTAWDATGNGLCYGPGRLAHLLDLQGPNLAVDTACSSSLVAVHLACQSLRLRECHLALAGGCHVHLSPQVPIMMSMSRALAPDGRCKAFDAAADGFGQGEGCGVVVLRRLSDALERGDTILALIRGSAVNHDGHSSGLTVPNQAAQERVIADALAHSRVEAREIGYVEAHGTGTPLGDPIEIEALAAALCGTARGHDDALRVGSVKTNIGHLEAAAGIAGLIKVVLALGARTIPPHLHLRQPNPRINWPALPIAVPTQPTPWPRASRADDAPLRLAGVSSFGMSGTNAHVVLQAAPEPHDAPAPDPRPVHVITVSARSAAEVRTQAERWAAHLHAHPGLALADVARTATVGRTHFPVRSAVVVASAEDAVRALSAVAAGKTAPCTVADDAEAEPPGVAFLFSGQGAQYAHMGRGLYRSEPAFRRCLERCDAVFAPQSGTSLVDLLQADSSDTRLNQTAYTQPALFALQCALAEMWRGWGVVPRVVLGHSVGEYAAACVAGVFELEDGMRLVAERARLMQALPGGAMASVAADEARVRGVLRSCGESSGGSYAPDVAIAAVNGERSVVVAGPAEPVRALLDRLAADGIGTHPLQVSHAFHSPMLEPMLGSLTQAAQRTPHGAPRVPCIANVTGRRHEGLPGATGWATYWAAYWATHARQPVRFAEGLDAVRRFGVRALLEIGPGNTLLRLAASRFADDPMLLAPSLLPGGDDLRTLSSSLASLYELGVPVDWEGVHRGRLHRPVSLPTYPFQRQRYWQDAVAPPPVQALSGPARGYRMAWQPQPAWQSEEAPLRQWWIIDNQGGLGARIGAALERRGARVRVVAAEAGLRSWLSERSLAPFAEGVLWCPHGTDVLEPRTDADAWLSAQARDCSVLAQWMQHLAAAAGHGTPSARLWVLTRAAVRVEASDDAPKVDSACVRAFAQSASLEHPALWGGLVDVSSRPGDADLAAVAVELSGPGGEDAVAVRNGRRWVARIEALPAAAHKPALPIALQADASYLVTGGLGALGLQMAAWMARRGARHLVLVGRHAPSPSALQAIASLQRQGVSVVTARADVAVRADLKRVLDDIRPALRGVVHAAGVLGHAPLDTLELGAIESVLRAKVLGAAWLHRLTAALKLDLFVMFSSVAAWWGSKGQAHYAAANAFLDALANHRAALGQPAISLAWGPWNGAGMATPEAHDWLARIGVRGLAPDDALAAMERHLAGGEPNVAIADVDWPRLREVHSVCRDRPLLECVAPAQTPDQPPAPTAATDPTPVAAYAHLTVAERRDWLLGHVQQRVAGVLALDQADGLDVRKGLFRLGMDSLMAVELRNRLVGDFGIALPSTVVFDRPSIAGLAGALAHKLGWDEEDAALDDHPSDPPSDPLAERIARLESLVRVP